MSAIRWATAWTARDILLGCVAEKISQKTFSILKRCAIRHPPSARAILSSSSSLPCPLCPLVRLHVRCCCMKQICPSHPPFHAFAPATRIRDFFSFLHLSFLLLSPHKELDWIHIQAHTRRHAGQEREDLSFFCRQNTSTEDRAECTCALIPSFCLFSRSAALCAASPSRSLSLSLSIERTLNHRCACMLSACVRVFHASVRSSVRPSSSVRLNPLGCSLKFPCSNEAIDCLEREETEAAIISHSACDNELTMKRCAALCPARSALHSLSFSGVSVKENGAQQREHETKSLKRICLYFGR